MSLEILEKVKSFLVKLVKDEEFRAQLMGEKTEEVRKFLDDGGYKFSQEEFETAAIKILELKELGEFHELSEQELVGAVGGIASIGPINDIVQPMYGVIIWPPEGQPIPKPRPKPQPQPLYGIVIDPPIQALYGVVAPTEELQ